MTIPCLIVSGFLGSGKTTFINSLLQDANALKLGILVNDFGEIPVDYDLIESVDDNIIELTGGCVCCSYGGDLLAAVTQMTSRSASLDALIIETSGLSLPRIVASSVALVQGIAGVDVLVLVDGQHFIKNIQDRYMSDTITRQIREADLIFVTKVDPADLDKQSQITQIFRNYDLNSRLVFTCSVSEMLRRLTDVSGQPCSDRRPVISESIFNRKLKPEKTAPESIVSFTIETTGEIDVDTLLSGISALGLPIIRAKGILQVTGNRFAVLQFVGGSWTVDYHLAPPTKCGLTFFTAGEAMKRDLFKGQLLKIFAASSSHTA